tara:strand:+ start:4428 stop:5255 length:828 start_codon:yes stop_codon:yes gene_type:complete
MRKILYIKNKIKKIFGRKKSNPFRGSPLVKEPQETKQKYIDIWEDAKRKDYPIINHYEIESGFFIKKEWLDSLALHTQIVIKKSKICYQHGRILYSTLRQYIKNNNILNINIVEIGTARGFSSVCMAKGLEDSNIKGKIITIDPLPHNYKIYWNCIDDWDGKKTRKKILFNYKNLIKKYIIFIEGKSKDELSKIYFKRIHFAFIDGEHDYENVVREFQFVSSRQLLGDIIIIDDYTIELFPEIVRAVDYLCKKYNYIKRVILLSNERGYVIAIKN